MSWKLTRKLMPVRFEVDEPICMIVPHAEATWKSSPLNSGLSSLMKICSASMSSFSTRVTRRSKSSS